MELMPWLQKIASLLGARPGPQPQANRFSSQNESAFIFTEVYRCGKIGKIALDSFVTHHPGVAVHVFGTPDDFAALTKHEHLQFHDLSQETQILENFKHGHRGTASLWAKLIIERPEKYLLHFDSDVVVRGPILGNILNMLESGFSLVGPRRNYQHNPNHRDDVRHLSDVVQTLWFGFNREFVTKRDYATLTKMCQGTYDPYGQPIIDFFDPVSFEILRNGGTAYYLSPDDYGGLDEYGSRRNAFAAQNAIIDFGRKLAHFSAVGSGMNFVNRREAIPSSISPSYVKHAKERYAVYCKLFYGENVGVEFNHSEFESLFSIKDWVQEKPGQ